MHRIALLQIRARLGDFHANLADLEAVYHFLGGRAQIDLAVFPEGAIVGHPPEGLAYRIEFRKAWQRAVHDAFERLDAAAAPPPPGFVHIHGGDNPEFGESGPAALAVAHGARVLLVSATRSYRCDRARKYENEVTTFVRRHGVWWFEANLAGGQGQHVFAGGSLVVAPDGKVRARAESCQPDAILFGLEEDLSDGRVLEGGQVPLPLEPEGLRRALVAGIRDMVDLTGAAGALVGLTGGLDSSVVAALAVDALGAGRVRGLHLPSAHSAPETSEDVLRLADQLGMECHSLDIDPTESVVHGNLDPLLAPLSAPHGHGERTDAAIRARIRGTLLMAMALRLNLLLLGADNKTEASLGYGALYGGDMVGALSPLGDVYKTQIAPLGHQINRRAGRERIPERILLRTTPTEDHPPDDIPPSPEQVDPLLIAMNEEARPLEEIIARGFDPALAEQVMRRLFASEYKRRQAIPPIWVQPSADWPERRLPMLHAFRLTRDDLSAP